MLLNKCIMKKFLLGVCAIVISWMHVIAEPIINLNIKSPSVVCATGNDSVSFAVSASGIPANTNIVIYQSADSTFNPYQSQGDSIAFIPGNAIPRDTINFGNCVKTLGIFIDACGATGQEGRNEYIMLTSGTGVRVSNLAINFDAANSNSGNNNDNDINTGTNPCSFKTPDAGLISGLQVGSCNASNIIPASPSDSIPPNAVILCFTSDNVTANYSVNGLCNLGYPVYVVQSACTRTIGAFTNAASCSTTPTTRYRKTIAIDKRQNCQDNFVYDRCGLFDLDGTYAIRQVGTDTARVSNNGIRRNAIDTCGGIDYAQLDFTADTILKFSISPNLCNQGYQYIKAVTKPAGNSPSISNSIQYKLVCNDVRAANNAPVICSGSNTDVDISTTNPNAGLSWTIIGTPKINGALPGSGNSIQQALTNTNPIIDSVSYLVAATDEGCVESSTVTVKVNPEVQPQIDGNLVLCNNTPTTLTVSGTFDSVRWSTNETTTSIDASQAGSYSVTAYLNNCSGTAKVNVENTLIDVTVVGNFIICNNGEASVQAIGTFDSLRWSNGTTGPNFSTNIEGSYYVTAYLNGCSDVALFRITNCQTQECNPSIKGNFSICQGDSTVLDAGAGFSSYTWNTGATTQTIVVKTAGKYVVNVTGDNNCTGKDSVTVTVNELPQVAINGVTQICPNQIETLTVAADADSVRWNTGATTTAIQIAVEGTYSVTAYKNGCSNTASTQVVLLTSPLPFTLGNDTSICVNSTLTLSTGNETTTWNTGEVRSGINITKAGTYIATISTTCGSISDTIVITTTNCSGDIWLPNAFSPNGDGVNDVFMVRADVDALIESFVIYNRWGMRVFEATDIAPNDPTKGWDGKYKSASEQVEVYGYHVVAKFKDGSKKILKGNVTLLK